MPTGFSFLSHIRRVPLLAMAIAILTLSACTTAPTPSDGTAGAEPAETAPSATPTTTTETAPASPTPANTEVIAQPAQTRQVSIDVSCKDEPYGDYEKQSRASIEKGLSATTAGRYGVGFRNLDEHKKWSQAHNALFTAVNDACVALNECAKEHPKDKTQQCAQQATHFAQWQELSKRFAEKASQAETTQPPEICSFTPSLDDAAGCFHALADNVDRACNSDACKATSDCWRGVGFLDGAIRQASSACGFVHQELSECRGYLEAVQRREAKFQRCTQMQQDLNVRVIPVL